jgi:polysaccharide chain length determinant protein (PEP-CTERM system associated)
MDGIRTLIQANLKAAWRHRWLALAAAWVICGLGWVGVMLIPNIYQSTARLYVDADAVLTPLLKGIAADTQPASQLEILQRTLLSRPNMDKLISKTDLDLQVRDETDRQRLVTNLTSSIHVVAQDRNLFTIDYRNTNPRLAYDVVQQLLTIFVESATGTNRTDMANARLFLQRQISLYETQLREAERRRADFQAKYVELLPEATAISGVETGGVASKLESARGRVGGLTGQLKDAIAKRDTIKQELASTPPTIVTDPGEAGGGGSRLADLQRQLVEARLHDTDNHPDVIALKGLIAALKAHPSVSGGVVAGRPARSAPNPLFDSLKERLVDADSVVASLTRQVGEAKSEQARLEGIVRQEPELEAEYKNLDRDYSVLRHNYEQLLARREEANIAQAADTQADKVKLQVVDPPQISKVPVAPNRLLLLSGVFIAGIGGGLGLAVLLAQFDRSFRSIDDLRSLGLPVLGGLSMVAAAASRRRYGAIFAVGIGFVLLGAVYGGLIARTLHLVPALG